MHDFYHSRLLNDPTQFQPRSGNRSLEVFLSDRDATPTLKQTEIEEHAIQDWVVREHVDMEYPQGCETQRPHLRLLIGSPEQHQSDAEILPLPISRDTFEALRIAWGLPKELLRMMLSSLPIADDFKGTDAKGRPVTGVMIRSARSRDWNFCLGLAYNEKTGVLHGILNGMQNDEIALLLDCLQKTGRGDFDSMLLPIFLLELKVHYFAVLLEKRARGIEKIEYMTGMRHGFSSDPKRNMSIVKDVERERILRELDFDEITRKLTGLTGTLSFCDMTFCSSLRALHKVDNIRSRINPQREPRGDVEIRVSYLRELIVGSQALGAVLTDRTKAQVQTVYSLIGQKDNRLNIETAAASREIAEVSLGHNTAMKDMAEDSRNVAILTQKDSTNMRIIAVVTLLFLPGTFMATFFSAGFFNFFEGKQRQGQVVSRWIWLYFVLTGGTTLVVFAGWAWYSKRQN
ncbi:hypothetical protein PV08_00182 [Exophiala spinifera]|uniref:Uncharacterized protein n=1 Tax=Exophiala spinifera TaxID=91928 RepID=A0A0D2C7R9_9EURO|nr:uncharacterized protein PV08_00182 [Exophiala spinifera]KIW19609.1 hypothetical protein PV08_00182 [Exophiala spinifera]